MRITFFTVKVYAEVVSYTIKTITLVHQSCPGLTTHLPVVVGKRRQVTNGKMALYRLLMVKWLCTDH